MAITRLNSLAIPAGTVEPADISYPLTNFSSTGIDDNADATAITIDSSENVGIGTASPAAQLNLSSPNNIGGASGTFTNAALKIGTTATGMFFDSNEIHGGETLNFFSRGTDNSVADYIRFSTGGSAGGERLRIDSSGNVGIGTTSPNYDLEISSAANELRLTNTGTNSTYAMLNTANNNASMKVVRQGTNASSVEVKAFGNASSITMSNYAGVETRFDSLSGGDLSISLDDGVTDKQFMYFDYITHNIGIGTASPSKRLHIDTATNGGILLEDSTNSITGIFYSSGSNSLALGSTSNHPVKFFTNNSERMRLNASGNVGIGTTSPGGILHLRSDDNGMIFQSSSGVNARTQIFFQNTGGTTTGKIAVDPDGGNANVMAFSTGATERMRIDSSGNVGIGTTPASWGSSSTVLHVGDASGFWNFSLGANRQTNIVHNLYYDGQFKPRVTDGYGSMHIVTGSQNGAATFNFYSGNGTADTAVSLNQIATLSQNGLNFGTDTAAANALDDYEEGTWSPSLSTGSATFTSPKYTKIGRLVFLEVLITAFSDRTTSSAIVVNGLPYTTSANSRAAGNTLSRYINSGGDQVVTWVGTSRNYMTFYTVNQGSDYQNVQHNQLNSASSNFHVSVVYET